MKSAPEHALYEGTVSHHRRDPEYGFRAPLMLAFLDLDRLDTAWHVHPGVSDRRGRPVRYDRRDHPGDPTVPLAHHVRDVVEAHLGIRPEGRIRMLAGLRTFGRGFNPIVVHWCEDADGRFVAQVLDVTNTPWGERHSYVLDTRAAGTDGWCVATEKALHVSPFLPMDLRHAVRSGPPDDRIVLTIDDLDRHGVPVFQARLALRRRPFDRPTLTRYLTRYAFASQRVTAGIYRHALGLLTRGARVHRHPTREGAPVPSS